MSGIAGIIHFDGKPVEPGLIEKMTSAMAHRGPDGIHHWVQGSVALGQCMLRTTLESSAEILPQTDITGQLAIVADARIDNRQELISTLGLQNIESSALSDSELILHAYQKWRADCVKQLLGDFTFVIWDRHHQTIFCARDHFGIKPFYYRQVQQSFYFSSEIGALLTTEHNTLRFNESALGDFFLFGYNTDAASTFFQGIECLTPAHTLQITAARKTISSYWTLPTEGNIRYRRIDDYIQHFRELLATAVNDRVYSTNTGVLLSGGMDSSAVAAMAARGRDEHAPDANLKAYTFTAHGIFPADQEGRYAGQIAAHLNCPIRYYPIDHCPLFDRWDQPFYHPQEPTYYPFSAGRLELFQQMNQDGVRVVLSGEGGDPLLATDPTYFINLFKHRKWNEFLREISGYLRLNRSLRGLGGRTLFRSDPDKPWAPAFPDWLQPHFVSNYQLRERWSQHYQQTPASHAEPLNRRSAAIAELGVESASYWSRIFEEDRSAKMALDFRYPFFDLRLIEYALSIPAFLARNKNILRRTVAAYLPPAIWQRPKTAFYGDLIRHWLEKSDGRKALTDPLEHVQGLINQRRYQHALQQYLNTNGMNFVAWDSILLLTPISLNQWLTASSLTIEQSRFFN